MEYDLPKIIHGIVERRADLARAAS